VRISAKADYAIRALVELATDSRQPRTCEAIASSQDIPYRFLKAVVRDLRKAGLVRSQRGCEGGYWIGRDPGTIQLAEVVAAVDGVLFTVHGESPSDLAYAAPAQRVPTVWDAIRARTEEILGGVTVADLMTDAPAEPAAALLRVGLPVGA
jgi:Rrf2 family protein